MLKTKISPPVKAESVRRRKPIDATAKPPGGRFSMYSFAAAEGDEVELVRGERGTYHVVVSTSNDGARITAPIERIRTEALSRRMLEAHSGHTDFDGYRPEFADVRFAPEVTARPLRVRRGEDRPAHVFPPDSRYVYHDNAFPWRTVGRVWTSGGSGTACTIGQRLVLTASHVIDWQEDGGAGWAKFSPGYYNGPGPWGEYNATRVVYWNRAEGGLTDLETAFDYAVLVMDEPVGEHVGYAGYRAYNDDWNGESYWQHMGYPGDLTGAERPAFVGKAVVSNTSSETLSGQDGLVLGHFNDITGGHSGGPVWGWWSGEPWPRVVGVQSAEADRPGKTTSGDNEFGGGAALSALISYSRNKYA